MGSGEEEEEVFWQCDPFTINGFGNLLTCCSLPALLLLKQALDANLSDLTQLLWIVPSLGLCLNNANYRRQLARKPSATATSSIGLEEDEGGERCGEEAE